MNGYDLTTEQIGEIGWYTKLELTAELFATIVSNISSKPEFMRFKTFERIDNSLVCLQKLGDED